MDKRVVAFFAKRSRERHHHFFPQFLKRCYHDQLDFRGDKLEANELDDVSCERELGR